MTIDPVSLAITVALTAASMAATAMQKIEGPRLSDLNATVADYGTPLNYVYGRRRVECPCFYIEDIKEVKKKRKTKGGKYKDYTYFGTFAIAITDHEIQSVKSVWFDRHLVYDIDAEGATSIFTLDEDYELAYSMQIYLGTEDQEPNERMLARVEAEEGAGTCPAYLGVSYIFFTDVPLEKIGNRFPQVSVELVGIGGAAHAYDIETLTRSTLVSGHSFSSGNMSHIGVSDNGISTNPLIVIANSTRSPIVEREMSGEISTVDAVDYFGLTGWEIASDDTIYGTAWDDSRIIIAAPGFGATSLTGLFDLGVVANDIRVFEENSDPYIVAIQQFAFADFTATVTTWNIDTSARVDTVLDFAPRGSFQDSYGDIWIVGIPLRLAADNTTLRLQRVVNTGNNPGSPGSAIITDIPEMTYLGGGFNGGTIQFPIGLGGNLYYAQASNSENPTWLVSIDMATFEIALTREIADGFYIAPADYLAAGQDKLWISDITAAADNRTLAEIETSDLTTLRSFNLDLWYADEDGDLEFPWGYDPLNNALITSGSNFSDTDYYSWRYLPSDGDLFLQTIIDDVSARIGVDADKLSSVLCTQELIGYSWTQGPAKDILAPLCDVYDVDPRPHDFGIEFLPRGTASDATITTPDFVRQNADDIRYKITTTSDTDLPRRLFLTFADFAADQQPNTAVAQRPADIVDSAREMSFDLTTLALQIDEAADLTARLIRRPWFARERAELGLTCMELALEPGDIRTVDFDGTAIDMRLIKMNIGADGVIATKWERDHPSITLLAGKSGAAATGRPPSIIYDPGPTVGFVLDIPLLADVQDQAVPFVYLAAGPEDAEKVWSGADFWASDTGIENDFAAGWDSIGNADGATYGTVTESLPAASADVIDNGSVISVTLGNGELESTTKDLLLANGALNLALIGSELVQFMTATLVAPLQYELSGFIRGVRGTEQHIGTHDYLEDFVLMSSVVKVHTMGAGEIGDTDYYVAATQGRNADFNNVITVDFAAVANKPYSPVHLSATLSGGDWTIGWTRRTRIGGATLNGQDVPLGETSESYKVQIMDGATVKRTITSTTPSVVYPNADQVSDFGAPQTSLSYRVAQVSPALSLDGFYTAAAA